MSEAEVVHATKYYIFNCSLVAIAKNLRYKTQIYRKKKAEASV